MDKRMKNLIKHHLNAAVAAINEGVTDDIIEALGTGSDPNYNYYDDWDAYCGAQVAVANVIKATAIEDLDLAGCHNAEHVIDSYKAAAPLADYHAALSLAAQIA